MKQLVISIIGYAVQRNADPLKLCKLAGINNKDLDQKDFRPINEEQFEQLWFNAERLIDDPIIGLHLGESLVPTALGIVGSIIQSSATVGEALTHAASLISTVTDKCRMELKRGRGKFSVHLIPTINEGPLLTNGLKQLIDMLMVMVIHEMDGLLLEKIVPTAVYLPYQREYGAEYDRVFRCRVTNRHNTYSIIFEQRYWDVPILTADYELQELLLQKISQLPQNRKSTDTYRVRIYNYLLANSYLGLASIDDIASNFNMTVRSMQRRLKDENITFQKIADDVRCSLAKHYITSGSYPLKDISHILGYNEISAFTRAFKRWTGKSPTAYYG